MRRYVRNAYRRVADTLGVERYQSVPLYLLTDTLTPECYGRDGTIAYLQGHEGSFCRILSATFFSFLTDWRKASMTVLASGLL